MKPHTPAEREAVREALTILIDKLGTEHSKIFTRHFRDEYYPSYKSEHNRPLHKTVIVGGMKFILLPQVDGRTFSCWHDGHGYVNKQAADILDALWIEQDRKQYSKWIEQDRKQYSKTEVRDMLIEAAGKSLSSFGRSTAEEIADRILNGQEPVISICCMLCGRVYPKSPNGFTPHACTGPLYLRPNGTIPSHIPNPELNK